MTGLKLMSMRKAILTFLFGLPYLTSFGQTGEMAPITRTYAIKNARIIQAPGRVVEGGILIIKNGVIKAVGKNINIPAEARIIAADSLFVYAGFIDGLSNTGVPKPNEEERSKVKDPGNPPDAIAGIEPQRDVRNLLDPGDRSVDEMRRLGFTAAHTVPHGRMLPGQGAIILLAGAKSDDMVYKGQVSLFSQLTGAPGIYPNTVIGVMAKYRELYRQAEQAKAYNARYAQDAIGMERPASNRVLEAFYPVINKQIPVVFKAEDVLSIQRVLDLKNQLGFNLMLAEIKQGWDITQKLKSSGAKLFLSLDLPEMEDDKLDSTKTDESNKKPESDPEKQRLQERNEVMMKKYYHQPALFQSQGILFGFSTHGAKAKDIKVNLAKLVDNGLSEDAALSALTTTPAQLLGLSSTMGTLDQGKMANLVITDKSYFDKESKVKYVFVDGEMFEYKDKPKTKKSEESVKVTGKWTYTTETPQGVGSGDIIILGEEEDYSGTISSTITGDTNDLSGISVDGNEWSFSFDVVIDGNTITVDVLVTIDGDTFEGSMTAGEYGSFPIEGERTPGQ